MSADVRHTVPGTGDSGAAQGGSTCGGDTATTSQQREAFSVDAPRPLAGTAPGADDPVFRLHTAVRRWIWERGWRSLYDIQARAIEPILEGRDVILAAPTAGGKTEAAFLPICSAIAGEKTTGVAAMAVVPLKALINDQFDRLCDLCEPLGIPVHRWHGDVPQTHKQRLLKQPSGVLLITPESLEALFVNHGTKLPRLLGGLRFVVVDELHALIGTERGRQLQSLLHRTELMLRRRVPRIGLSATLGDMDLASRHLRPSHPQAVTVITALGGREVKILLKGFCTREPNCVASGDGKEEACGAREPGGGLHDVVRYVYSQTRGRRYLVFANARSAVEQYTDGLRELCGQRRVPVEYFPHHGNLSREIREEAEGRLRCSELPTSVVCTSTLELGIDVGSVDGVFQIGAPPSVASLRQRLGRSGRRGDEASVLHMIAIEEELGKDPLPQNALRPQLAHCVAVISLLVARWCEPPDPVALHLSTLVQQVLSLIAQHGAVAAKQAWEALCHGGPFASVVPELFARVLRALGAAELLMQASDGALMLAPKGERLVNHYSFYAAFQTPEEYRVTVEARTLGTLPIYHAVQEDAYIIFAGRRWRVRSVDPERKVIEVAAAAAGRAPNFTSLPGLVHDRVREEMRGVYLAEAMPPFIDERAKSLLVEGREEFARRGLGTTGLIEHGEDTVVFPWAGDRAMNTLLVALRARGLQASMDGVAIGVSGARADTVRGHLAAMAQDRPPDPLALAASVADKVREKYHPYLTEDLLCADYASAYLDTHSAWQALRRLVAREEPGS